MLHCSFAEVIAAAVVGPNSLFREGLKGILHSPYQVETVAEAIDYVEKIADFDLFIIVADANQNALLAQVRRAKEENASARVVVMGDSDKSELVWPVLAAGADGYLLRNISLEALRASLDAVMLGGTVVLPTPVNAFPTISADCTGLQGVVAAEVPKLDPETDGKKLSDRETEILLRLTKGESNKQIARKFEITEATVKVHLKAILRKIRVSNRTQAAVWAHNNYVTRSPRLPQAALADFAPDASQGSVVRSKYKTAQEDRLSQSIVVQEAHRSLRTA